ncbi:glycoside hydrolase family protein [Flammeovirgaceae bacterium 311]|nr:glycoside hydrolase family protein [Flammeovirgaceae bacterium 311]
MLIAVGCEKEEDAPEVVPPSDLTVQVQQNEQNPAKVSLQFSARDANYYLVYFGDATNETPLNTTAKTAEHTYTSSGTYTIRVQAHATAAAFVTESREVTVELNSGGDNGIPGTGYTTPESYEGMSLVWQDEFDGDQLNTANWVHETGTGSNGWGNEELQYYRPENTTVQDGYLIITAKKESFGGRDYTSSRIKTQGKQSFQYGRIDIRAALPNGQGIWPALWMLGNNITTVGWPASGEIDIMELIGGGPGKDNTVHGTIHWSNAGQYANYGKGYTLNSGIFSDEFHVFSIEWTPTSIIWYIDDEQFNIVDITPAELSEFHQNFFFIFNVAVGGRWPGSPNASTVFPQRMVVDYVRVFQPE